MDIKTQFILLLFIALILSLAFCWRGFVKSNRVDLIAGCCLFCIAFILGSGVVGDTGVINLLGIVLPVFSIVPFMTRELSSPNRLIITIGLIMLGLLFLLVV